MRMILAKGKTKREITGPFLMCISRQDARRLAKLLNTHADKCVYGWLDVSEDVKLADTEGPPLSWE